MSLVKLFIDDVQKSFLSCSASKQGSRAMDSLSFVIPATVAIIENSKINYLVDIVDLTELRLALTMQNHIKDESGLNNNALGSSKIAIPLSKWRFDNSLVDIGGLQNDLVVAAGSETYVAGKVGASSFSFNGSTYLQVTDAINYKFERNEPFAVAFWVYPSGGAGTDSLVVKSNDLTTGVGWKIFYDWSTNKITFTLADGTTGYSVTSAATFAADTWSHCTCTFDASSNRSGMKIYKDSILDATGTSSVISNTIESAALLSLGGESDGGSLYQGRLDDVTIFGQMITQEDITGLYNLGIVSYVDGRWGKALNFNGLLSLQILNETQFDFERTDSISYVFWIKSSTLATSKVILAKKANLTATGYALYLDSSDRLVIDFTNINGTNQLQVRTGSYATILLNGQWHQVVVTYSGTSNPAGIKLYVDNIDKTADLLTVTNNLTASILNDISLRIGNHGALTAADYLVANVEGLRVYKRALIVSQINVMNVATNPKNIMAFGGSVRSYQKKMATKEVEAKSYGFTLSGTDVRGEVLENKSPEDMVEFLVNNNTNLQYVDSGLDSMILIKKYVADGQLLDLLNDLTTLTVANFRTDAVKNFYYEPLSFKLTNVKFEHGVNSHIFVTGKDDTELVNDLTILGENKKYMSQETFSGTGSKTVFNLTYAATSARVLLAGVEGVAEVDYTIDTENKQLIFTVAPPSASNNIVIFYQYEQPLFIRQDRPDSIVEFGKRAKRLIMPWLRRYDDGVRFASAYLNAFSDVRGKVTINILGLFNAVQEGDIIRVVNSVKGIDSTYAVRSVNIKYPDGTTQIIAGEFTFDMFESHKQIVEKLHDLESAITVVKDIREYESMQESLGLVDVVEALPAETFLETIVLSDSAESTERFQATYNGSTTNYSQNDVYTE